MEEKQVLINIDGQIIPRQASGVHKIEKVQFFKSRFNDKLNEKKVEYTYGTVMLDNGVVITIIPDLERLSRAPFNRVQRLLLLSEGKTFNFVEPMNI